MQAGGILKSGRGRGRRQNKLRRRIDLGISACNLLFRFFAAGISAADLSSLTSNVSAFLHPSLYVCARCLPLQAGQDASEGLIAVKL